MLSEYLDNVIKDVDAKSEILKGERNSFLLSLMVISSYAIQADGKIMHSEMEFVRNFLTENYGAEKKEKYEKLLLALFAQSKLYTHETWSNKIEVCTRGIATYTTLEQRQLLFAYLVKIVKADNNIASTEIVALENVANWLGVSSSNVENIKMEGTNVWDS